MNHRCIGILVAATLAGSSIALAQPAPGGAAPPTEPGPAPPAAAGFELRQAPEGSLVTGKEALRRVPGGLTASAVAARAVEESPEAKVQAAKVRAAAAKVDQTVVQFLPRVKVSATYRRVSKTDMSLGSGAMVGAQSPGLITVGDCPIPELAGQQCALDGAGNPIGAAPFDLPTFQNYYLLNATVGIPLSDYVLRFSSAIKASQGYAESARLQRRAADLSAAANAKLAYYDWLRAVAAVAVAESSLSRVQASLRDTSAAFTLGAATKADVMRLEALVANTEQMGVEARGFRRLAAERLATLMNEPVREYEVGEEVLSTPTGSVLAGASAEQLIAEAQKNRIEVQALHAALRSLDQGVKATRVSQYPRLDAFGDFTYAKPNPNVFLSDEVWKGNWAVGLSLSYTINDLLDSRTSTAELAAQREELQANLEQLERGVRLEVVSALNSAQNARSDVASAQRGAAAAAEAYRVSRELYRAGRATTTDLMGAEAELVSAELKEINTLLDLRAADVKLEHAVGRDLPRR